MLRLSVVLIMGAVLVACEQQSSGLAGTASHMAMPHEADAAKNSTVTAGNGVPLAIAASDPALQWGPCPDGMPKGCGIAVLRGDPGKPNADIFLRVPGGATIPPHAHSSVERMILVSGKLEVKYRGAAKVVLRAGHYAYGPAKLPHRATCGSKEPCTLFIAFEGPVDVLPFTGSID